MIIHKRRTYTLSFDCVESRKFRKSVKSKATGTPLRDVLYTSSDVSIISSSLDAIYMHRRGAFCVARSDGLGDARALHSGAGDRQTPRFVFNTLNSLKCHLWESEANVISYGTNRCS